MFTVVRGGLTGISLSIVLFLHVGLFGGGIYRSCIRHACQYMIGKWVTLETMLGVWYVSIMGSRSRSMFVASATMFRMFPFETILGRRQEPGLLLQSCNHWA